MRFLLILVGVVCLALPACAPPQQTEPVAEEAPSTEADVEAYKEMLQRWDTAFNAGDANGLADLYTNDAVRMEPDSPAWQGKEAIRTGFATFFEAGEEQYTIEVENIVDDIVILGDWACVRGTGKVTWNPKGGAEAIHPTSKFMSFNKRQPDGSWKIVCDIWNADAPLPVSFGS